MLALKHTQMMHSSLEYQARANEQRRQQVVRHVQPSCGLLLQILEGCMAVVAIRYHRY